MEKKKTNVKKILLIIFLELILIVGVAFGTYKYTYYSIKNGNPIENYQIKKVSLKYLNENYKDLNYSFEFKEIIPVPTDNSLNVGYEAKKDDISFLFYVNIKDKKIVFENFKEQNLCYQTSKEIKDDLSKKTNLDINSIQLFLNSNISIKPNDTLETINQPLTILVKQDKTSLDKEKFADSIVELNTLLKTNKYYRYIVQFVYLNQDDINKIGYQTILTPDKIDINKDELLKDNLIQEINLQ